MPAKDDESRMNEKECLGIDSVRGCPLEERFKGGYIMAYWDTIREILFQAGAFFSKLSPHGPYRTPVVFAVVTTILAFLGSDLWAILKDWASGDLSPRLSSSIMKMVGGKFTLADATQRASIIVVGVMFQVVACHLVLKRLCPTYQGFRATWRVYFYAQAAQIAYILPFVGSAIAPVWYAIVLTVGMAEVHRTRIEIALFGSLVIAATTPFLAMGLQLVLFWHSQKQMYDYGLLWRLLLNWI